MFLVENWESANESCYKSLKTLCVSMFSLHVCVCIITMPGAHGSQKKVLDPLELKVKIAVSHHVDAES